MIYGLIVGFIAGFLFVYSMCQTVEEVEESVLCDAGNPGA